MLYGKDWVYSQEGYAGAVDSAEGNGDVENESKQFTQLIELYTGK